MSTRETVLARLTAESSPQRTALLRAALDHLATRPIASFVDVPPLVALAKKAVTQANVARILAEHGRPGLERQKTRSARLGETLGDLAPPDMEERLGRILDGTKLPEPAWAKGVVDAKLANKLVSPVVQQTLLSFAKKLPIPGMNDQATGAASALGGALLGGLGGLAGGAGKLLDVGKSVVGGLSAEFEKKLQVVARDFAENASDEFRANMKKRLESDEGKAIVRELVLTANARLRGVAVTDVLAEADNLPAAELDALVAATLAHNAARPAIADALRAELNALLAVDGATTLGDYLDRAGIRAEVEAVILARGDAELAAFFRSPGFAVVLAALFDG